MNEAYGVHSGFWLGGSVAELSGRMFLQIFQLAYLHSS